MNLKRIVITGGPGTGKTSIINELIDRGHICFEEISRQVIMEARDEGIEHLFKSDPLLFSKRLLQGRIDQFLDAEKHHSPVVFIDRGIPDVLAYMDFVGSKYPDYFIEACETHIYDAVFILAPWQDIFVSDDVRYESFEEAKQIHQNLLQTYSEFGYRLTDVPFANVKERTDHILNHLKG